MNKQLRSRCKKAIIAVFIITTSAFCAQAQLKGDHLLGDVGLDAGSQAPPSVTFAVPLYFYNTTTLKNSDGDTRLAHPEFNMFVTGVGVSWVSNAKILGANYGASVLFGFAQNVIEGNQVSSKSSFALSDTYLQPVQLGWHAKSADFLFTYSLYIPTGKYEVGGSDNSGLGMWGSEFAAGTTLFFDPHRTFEFSTLFSYETNSTKKNSDIKTGDQISIEGGLGKSFYQIAPGQKIPTSIVKFGMVYYMQFKASSDQIPAGPFIFSGSKDHIYAVGAEANAFLVKPGITIGARWLGELGAVNRFQGNTFFVTLAKSIIMAKEH